MARMRSRPRKLTVGPVSAFVIRGPKKDEPDQWYWQARVFRDGEQVTVWSGWSDREALGRTLADLVARDKLDAPEAKAVEIATVNDLLRYWVGAQHEREDLSPFAKRNYRNCARHVVKGLGPVKLDRLDPSTLDRYRDQRLRTGAAPSTVEKELKALRAAWAWGHEIGACPDRRLPRVKLNVKPAREKNTPSPEDMAAILSHLEGWPALATRLLWATGGRVGEIAKLRWGDVDLDRAELTVCGKTGRRVVPVHPDVVQALRAWGPGEPDAQVLGVTPLVVRGHLSSRWLKMACEAAGVPKISPNGIRRLAVDTLARSGVDVGTACALLGHSPQEMLKAYRQVNMDDRRRAVAAARLGALSEGKVVPFSRAGQE